MFQRKPRRFRQRPNGRGHLSHGNGHGQARPRSNSFSNNQMRNNFRPAQSAEKLLEKYSALAKEAITSGDKTLVENYLQHADHYMRIVEEKNLNQNKVINVNKEKVISSEESPNKISDENKDIKNQNSDEKK